MAEMPKTIHPLTGCFETLTLFKLFREEKLTLLFNIIGLCRFESFIIFTLF
jgi:hypothetical protein